MNQSCVHIYMGKGLPTAAGMALRAIGANFRVGFFIFDDLNFNVGLNIDAFKNRASEVYFQKISSTSDPLSKLAENVAHYDMVVLSGCDYLEDQALEKFIRNRPEGVELVLCGQSFSQKVCDLAGLPCWRQGYLAFTGLFLIEKRRYQKINYI